MNGMTAVPQQRMALGLTIVRVVVGIVFIAHGAQKLFGFGLSGITGGFTQMGVPLPTLSAPVVLRDEKRGRWLTLIRPKSFRAPDGRRFERAEVLRAMFEPGDGRVTRASLLGLDLAGTRASLFYATPLPVAYAAFACDLHSDLQNNKTLQDNALTLLINEMIS